MGKESVGGKASSRSVSLYLMFSSCIVFQLLVFLGLDSCSLKGGHRQASCIHCVPHGRSSSGFSARILLEVFKDFGFFSS